MNEIIFKILFNNDTFTGKLSDMFHIVVDDAGNVTSTYPLIWLLLLTIVLGIVGYLIGSINTSIVISKYVFHDDIRNHGSGNAGSTNMNRIYGSKFGVITLVLDILKGVIACITPLLVINRTAAAFAGMCCVIGHCFPIFFGFKGGKGVATSEAVICMIDPIVGLLVALTFLIMVVGTKYVSMGSVSGAFFFPIYLDRIYLIKHGVNPPAVMSVCAIIMMVLVIAKHHANIKRVMNRTESKISFRKKAKKEEPVEQVETAVKSLHHIDDDENSQEK